MEYRRRASKKKKKKKQKTTKNNNNNIDWSQYASTLIKALGIFNKRINNREDFNVLLRSMMFITS